MASDLKDSEAPEKKRRIGEMLVDEGLITQVQLDEALAFVKRQGGKTVENLIALRYLDAHEFLAFLSRQPGVASIDLLNYTIPKEMLELIPREFALKHEILPIDKMGRDLTVAMACPLDSKTIKHLEDMTKLRVRPLLVSINDTRSALDHYYGHRETHVFNLDDHAASKTHATSAGISVASQEEPEVEDTAAEVRKAPDGVKKEEGVPGALLGQVESAITFESIIHVVRDVTSLPALPETIAQVREAMANPETGTSDLADIIGRDPALSAKVLSLANSASMGIAHRVNSVELAAAMLGLKEIYSVVLSAAVIDYFDESAFFDYKEFWKRSLFCATAARVIGDACGREKERGLFCAGLLHDLGRAVLAEVAPARYAEIDGNERDEVIFQQEDRLFGVGHPEIGYILADTWGLPPEITEPIRFHHRISEASQLQDRVAIVGLASIITDAYGRITKENAAAFALECKQSMQLLGLGESQFVEILEKTKKAFNERTKD